ncbi:hypothetical protein C8R47DRAFT_1066060 [Mycena vitilis]|nr:hypothetical protein C8R47DRAFT_1066060 [Mycena vitilis]
MVKLAEGGVLIVLIVGIFAYFEKLPALLERDSAEPVRLLDNFADFRGAMMLTAAGAGTGIGAVAGRETRRDVLTRSLQVWACARAAAFSLSHSTEPGAGARTGAETGLWMLAGAGTSLRVQRRAGRETRGRQALRRTEGARRRTQDLDDAACGVGLDRPGSIRIHDDDNRDLDGTRLLRARARPTLDPRREGPDLEVIELHPLLLRSKPRDVGHVPERKPMLVVDVAGLPVHLLLRDPICGRGRGTRRGQLEEGGERRERAEVGGEGRAYDFGSESWRIERWGNYPSSGYSMDRDLVGSPTALYLASEDWGAHFRPRCRDPEAIRSFVTVEHTPSRVRPLHEPESKRRLLKANDVFLNPEWSSEAPVFVSIAVVALATVRVLDKNRGRTVGPSAPLTPTKKEKSKPDPELESQWRASIIDPNQTINKSAIKTHYRLALPKDSGLKPTIEERVITSNEKDIPVKMWLYKEREIEYLAWKKHGGPARFEAYRLARLSLANLQEAHERKNPGKLFNKPVAYGGERAAPPPTLPMVLVDTRVPDPYPISVKKQLVDMGQAWLWEAANRGTPHLYMEEGSPSLLRLAYSYPRWPETSQIFSDSFTIVGATNRHNVRTSTRDENYLEVLFKALITVIREHGEDGWKSARWEVYDTYCECFPEYKLQYDSENKTWSDQAKDWLQGKMVLFGDRNIITTRRDNAVELGRVYNEMLPTVSY